MHSTRTATRARATAFIAVLASSMLALSACGGDSNANSSSDKPESGTYLGTADGDRIQLRLTIDDADVTLEEVTCRVNSNDPSKNTTEVDKKAGTLKEGTKLYWNGDSTYTELISKKDHQVQTGWDDRVASTQKFDEADESDAEEAMAKFENETCPDMKP